MSKKIVLAALASFSIVFFSIGHAAVSAHTEIDEFAFDIEQAHHGR